MKLAVARALQREKRPGPWRGNAAEEVEARLAGDVLRATPDNVDVDNWRWGQRRAAVEAIAVELLRFPAGCFTTHLGRDSGR